MDKESLRLAEEVSKEAAKQQLEERSFAWDLLTEFKKANKRQFIIILVLIGVLVASNFYWLYTFTQYDFVSTETTIDSESGHAILNESGSVNINGEDNKKNSE